MAGGRLDMTRLDGKGVARDEIGNRIIKLVRVDANGFYIDSTGTRKVHRKDILRHPEMYDLSDLPAPEA